MEGGAIIRISFRPKAVVREGGVTSVGQQRGGMNGGYTGRHGITIAAA